MPHADSSLVPEVQTKAAFWEHVHTQLEGLLDGQVHWVSNLSNASSLIFNSLLAFRKYFGNANNRAVNWCGFYIDSTLFPSPRLQVSNRAVDDSNQLLLGPFCGKPACQFIQTAPGKAKGVCADAYLQAKTIVVPEVDLYPGISHATVKLRVKLFVLSFLILMADLAFWVFWIWIVLHQMLLIMKIRLAWKK